MLPKSRCKNTVAPFVLLLLIVLIHSPSISQVSGKAKGPLQVYLSAARVQSNTVLITVRFLGHSKVTDGALILEVSRFRSQGVDTVRLWSGNSDSDRFDLTFSYPLDLPVGKKAYVACTYQGKVTGMKEICTGSRGLSIYNLSDTLLQAYGSYEWLDWTEIDYLIKKKGYEQMSEDEIRAIDPKFWKRIQYVKHGHGRKNKK